MVWWSHRALVRWTAAAWCSRGKSVEGSYNRALPVLPVSTNHAATPPFQESREETSLHTRLGAPPRHGAPLYRTSVYDRVCGIATPPTSLSLSHSSDADRVVSSSPGTNEHQHYPILRRRSPDS